MDRSLIAFRREATRALRPRATPRRHQRRRTVPRWEQPVAERLTGRNSSQHPGTRKRAKSRLALCRVLRALGVPPTQLMPGSWPFWSRPLAVVYNASAAAPSRDRGLLSSWGTRERLIGYPTPPSGCLRSDYRYEAHAHGVPLSAPSIGAWLAGRDCRGIPWISRELAL
jgi:hypothetical protein